MEAIGDRPTPEMYASGKDIDCQCARCGSSAYSDDCGACEDGYVSRFEEDPLWYDEDDLYPCEQCQGRGVFHFCGSSEEWCKANPMPGREGIERGEIEWFTV